MAHECVLLRLGPTCVSGTLGSFHIHRETTTNLGGLAENTASMPGGLLADVLYSERLDSMSEESTDKIWDCYYHILFSARHDKGLTVGMLCGLLTKYTWNM